MRERHFCYGCKKHLYEELFPTDTDFKAQGRKCTRCRDNIANRTRNAGASQATLKQTKKRYASGESDKFFSKVNE
ncbi:hypothetical protein [Achromobacter phage Motura]|uniref:Uncharacterized protein n=1 Tax=Achromobacter phage Motura TaxID=2591403 RepID=A0A514CST7_9CAUD|nr:hypothetical protein H1O15_gp240 [Achromobacter phage Motura]QDH83548.1 hypothetical protein [Achromobacter phage Motura]